LKNKVARCFGKIIQGFKSRNDISTAFKICALFGRIVRSRFVCCFLSLALRLDKQSLSVRVRNQVNGALESGNSL
jgi:hypothetical protein